MRAETGRAVLAAIAHQNPGASPSPSPSPVDRLATTRTRRPGGSRQAPAAGAMTPTTQPGAAPSARPLVAEPPEQPVRALVDVAPELVRPPAAARRLGVALTAHAGVALLAAHGGAGVNCLLRAGLNGIGAVDADGSWPAVGPVLLVARTSTHGLERARDLARQHASGTAGPATQLLGLVLVADAPGRPPRRLRELADLVSGAFARTWQVPWLEEWRLAAASEPLPMHPSVAELIADLRAAEHRPA